ncbi:hypothetical protein O7626_26050 [Micromonospora sp. WMMD1102]|uniref:WXG100-like domain-containing protein n=1 Tax=Micromonospora sp. WMMD1102 TaxID=3016105 RepID=UPI00241507EE|nr:hypothetical protein [Micromonospora sp. WMMD1102]MDG4789345.1 hypothetical protein [Micromonospora sp. WMMD1102]
MGIELPSSLVDLLSTIGFRWPESDETKLLELGRAWSGLSGQLDAQVAAANGAAAEVWTAGRGELADVFRTSWTRDAAPAQRLAGGASGADIVGAGLMTCAAIVLALKINIIAQATLTVLAIAAAIATGGLAAAGAAALREACRRALDWLLNEAIMKIVNG